MASETRRRGERPRARWQGGSAPLGESFCVRNPNSYCLIIAPFRQKGTDAFSLCLPSYPPPPNERPFRSGWVAASGLLGGRPRVGTRSPRPDFSPLLHGGHPDSNTELVNMMAPKCRTGGKCVCPLF